MFVRKFEADTLEEALKDIKRELGPDAIILKTVTNKGLKGAFKKKRIEITAAISEKNYTKKAQVDRVLDTAQKDSFYSNQSSYVANMIDNYSANREPHKPAGYGGLALNKPVNTLQKNQQNPKSVEHRQQANIEASGLDQFLGENQSRKEYQAPERELKENTTSSVMPTNDNVTLDSELTDEILNQLDRYQHRVAELERLLFDLTKNVERLDRREPEGIYQLRNSMKSLDIKESYIQKMIKSATFELSREELENAEIVFEFALKQMLEEIPVAMPMFSSVDSEDSQFITVLLSESSSGQTSMIQKIAALKGESIIIQNNRPGDTHDSFAGRVFDLKTIYANGIGEIVSECRKAVDSGKSVFIDYRCPSNEKNETKKFLDGLRRAFTHVEVLVTLSAIHSEMYNQKVLNRYSTLSDGIVVSNIDQCLNFGSLFNLGLIEQRLPFKFFGNGETVPDDIEAATAERILAGLFQIS
jgi:flagellar biosynthesis protein FlhF